MPAESAVRKARRVVIACRVMEPELTHVLAEGGAGDDGPEIVYLDQVLHRTPGKLLSLVQEKIDQVGPDGVTDRPRLRPLFQRGRGRHGAAAGADHPPLP